MNNSFYKNKKVFITGHTGFKGTWLCKMLMELGADVYGYSLRATDEQKLFGLSGVEDSITSFCGDVRDTEKLQACVNSVSPDIMLHLAAQPLVKASYEDPVNTYSTNVMGTVNFLEAVRKCPTVRSVVNVTTDKVYLNREMHNGYKEDDELNGYDPYSNSKSCSELVTSSYKNSFFKDSDVAISTCRAGNVIGGGDFADNRIIPDCYRATSAGQPIILRNPNSVRPYQHVLDPLYAYLLVAEKQYSDKVRYEGSYNIGPKNEDNITTGELADMFCKAWGDNASWVSQQELNAVHEAGLLYLNCEKAYATFGWSPVWGINDTVEKTVEWYLCYHRGEDVRKCMESQISEFLTKIAE